MIYDFAHKERLRNRNTYQIKAFTVCMVLMHAGGDSGVAWLFAWGLGSDRFLYQLAVAGGLKPMRSLGGKFSGTQHA